MGKPDGKAVVLKYLTNQNRPYSVNDLVANLRNEIPKSVMQKALDALVQEEKVKEKVNGKQKAYVVNQDNFGELVIFIVALIALYLSVDNPRSPAGSGSSHFGLTVIKR